MKMAVLKFGGTSVSSKSSREKVIEKILEKYDQGYKTLVVVSAMGRSGEPYATDTLMELVKPIAINNREMDLLLSCGEIISVIILANEILQKGYKVSILTANDAGIETDSNFGNAEIINIYTDNILEKIEKNNITIVAGFQGKTKEGEITTLGRGGSDITAIALAKALNSKYVEIFTDVDGIMTADPNIINNAKILKYMCYSEVYFLAKNGASIIHPKAIKIAQESNIPLIIRNTYSNSEGTYIGEINKEFIQNRNKLFNEKKITSLTYKKNKSQIIISSIDKDYNLGNLIEKIIQKNINIDIISIMQDKKVFTIDVQDENKLVSILKKEQIEFEIIQDCCKLSILGYRIDDNPKILAKIIKAFSKENINILQASDPYNTFSCLIKEKDINKALLALHEEFKLYA
ncbi:MAG: aspartate kinase [Tissierellia bacterium]|nr:aspartate kinase [Tissierellia bacterium]